MARLEQELASLSEEQSPDDQQFVRYNQKQTVDKTFQNMSVHLADTSDDYTQLVEDLMTLSTQEIDQYSARQTVLQMPGKLRPSLVRQFQKAVKKIIEHESLCAEEAFSKLQSILSSPETPQDGEALSKDEMCGVLVAAKKDNLCASLINQRWANTLEQLKKPKQQPLDLVVSEEQLKKEADKTETMFHALSDLLRKETELEIELEQQKSLNRRISDGQASRRAEQLQLINLTQQRIAKAQHYTWLVQAMVECDTDTTQSLLDQLSEVQAQCEKIAMRCDNEMTELKRLKTESEAAMDETRASVDQRDELMNGLDKVCAAM